MDIRLIFLD